MAFAQILDELRIPFELEKILLNGDRAILVDLYLPKQNVAIEIDGGVHLKQRKYDAGRDRWLLEIYGVRTNRISNNEVLMGRELQKRLFKQLAIEVSVGS